MSPTPFRPSRARRIAALALLALPLGACAADRSVTGATYPRDYRERHPIVLSDAPRTLDVFMTGGAALDPRQHADIREFALEYRRSGKGPIAMQVPAGPGGQAPRLADAVRRVLAESGLAGAPVDASTYEPSGPALASPVRLSFLRLKAKVASKCGLWPQDLGVSDHGFNNRNETYWNYGCAMQTNVAAQIADPVDLVRGRTETPPDTQRRAKNIENIRQGRDPSTQYRQDGQGRINQSFGN